ncbi:MAG: DEAD/DEAH box helicase [Gammaproteobacteria bacterium]|jgi:ATP-dependent RNA helicase DeaD|nr:DEAD/DEAH box helicase [Gammaproteobacteria bacterium]
MSVEEVDSFERFALAEPVLRAVRDVGYEQPSPIQAQAIPPLLEGRDLLGQAQTGTGKTAAFALPLLSRLDLTRRVPQLLVLAPTRELAIQVAEATKTYARHLPDFHVLPVYGGQGMGAQLRGLSRGAHVVVGTPGRILDHLRRGTLVLGGLVAVVLDEADEMLRMGFIEDVEAILAATPQGRQTALFSATMPREVHRIAQSYLRDPVEIRIESRTTTVEAIRQRYWQVRDLHKLDALTRILEGEDFDAMIVFVRTRTETTGLAEKLEARGYDAAPLSGDMQQAERERTVDRLRQGRLDILVATDVAARGLDVPRISHVVNYDIPTDTEAYVHRIGRTGRAGRKGEAILFVSPREKRMLYAIERATGQRIEPMQLPSREDIADRRIDRFKGLITETIETAELDFFEALVADYQRAHDVGLSEIAAALAYLLQREQPLVVDGAAARVDAHPAEPVRAEAAESAPRPRQRREGAPPAQPRSEGAPAERPRRERRPGPEVPMERYRIEVGREHGVQPKNIVGAIANEAGLESRYIGRIEINDDHTLLDLPEGMPKEVFKHLKTVWVCGRQLRINRAAEPGGHRRRSED